MTVSDGIPGDGHGTEPSFDPGAAEQPYCWLTTTGRRSGEPRTVELWFALDGGTVWFLAGGGDQAMWVRNAQADGRVAVLLGRRTYPGTARFPISGSSEDPVARRALAAKYQGWRDGAPLSHWASTALLVAVDLASGTD